MKEIVFIGGLPAPDCSQYLLLSAGWCFLKQSLQ